MGPYKGGLDADQLDDVESPVALMWPVSYALR